ETEAFIERRRFEGPGPQANRREVRPRKRQQGRDEATPNPVPAMRAKHIEVAQTGETRARIEGIEAEPADADQPVLRKSSQQRLTRTVEAQLPAFPFVAQPRKKGAVTRNGLVDHRRKQASVIDDGDRKSVVEGMR